MNKVLLIATLLSLASCDAPIRSRQVLKSGEGLSTGNAVSLNPGTLSSGDQSTGTATGSTSGTSNVTSEAGFSSCDISAKYSTTDIGAFGICQSSQTETSFKVKFNQTTSTRNCLIPLYKDSAGSSTYVGQPQCTTVNDASAVISGSLPKTRVGFDSYPVNGVIVMKEALLNYYFACMNAYVSYPTSACPNGANNQYCAYYLSRCSYNGAQTSSECDAAARSYMTQICNQFKSQNSGKYADIRLK